MDRRKLIKTAAGVGFGMISAVPDTAKDLPERIGTYRRVERLSSAHPSVIALFKCESNGHRITLYRRDKGGFELEKNHSGDGIPEISLCRNSDLRVIRKVLKKWCREEE